MNSQELTRRLSAAAPGSALPSALAGPTSG